MGIKKIVTVASILFALSILNFGNYYIYDVPSELASGFLMYFDKTPADTSFLYTLSSAPSTVMSLISGFLVSWLTPTLTAAICTYMIFLSSVVTMYGTHSAKYNFIIIGRVMFGAFSDANQVAQKTLVTEVFFGRFLSIATGLCQVMNNLGLSASNFLTAGFWLNSRNISVPFFWAAISCAVSFLGVIIWVIVEMTNYKKNILDDPSKKKQKKREALKEPLKSAKVQFNAVSSNTAQKKGIDFSAIKDLKSLRIFLVIGNIVFGL